MSLLDRFHSLHRVEEPSHDDRLMEHFWGEAWGVSQPTGRLRKVLVHRPGKEVLQLHNNRFEVEAGSLILKEVIASGSVKQAPNVPPNIELLQRQHDTLTSTLRDCGAEVIELASSSPDTPDRLFVRDLGMVIPGGIMLSRFALYVRYGEIRLMQEAMSRIGMPILGAIHGHGFVEGGSFTMLNERLAAVGRSERVNDEGILQLSQLLRQNGIELLAVDLAASKIHLDEAFVMLDHNKALVDSNLLPYWFLQKLHSIGIKLIEIEVNDPPLTINCLPIAPGQVVFPTSGVRTIKLLEQNKIEVIPVDVSEMYKLGGGIHCATLDLKRDR